MGGDRTNDEFMHGPTSISREERVAALIDKAWADFVNCKADYYFGNRSKLEKQKTVLRRFADAIAALSPDVSQSEGMDAKEARWRARPNGDAGDALDYALDHIDDPFSRLDFLECWRGDDLEEWPDYIRWLNVQREGSRRARALSNTPEKGESDG